MSYINQNNLKMQKRRHSVKRVTPEEAVKKINQAIDEANNQVARALAHATAWQRVAGELDQENQVLRQRLADLEKENAQLKKRLKPKAGKLRKWKH